MLWEYALEYVVPILVAALCGFIIGVERERFQKPAGLRTTVLVCVGSALFTLLSFKAFPGADPARVAAQIVSGIGFLGAGTIIRSGMNIKGLTTAATLWVSAAIGMAAGGYQYTLALAAAILTLLVLQLLKPLENLVNPMDRLLVEVQFPASEHDKFLNGFIVPLLKQNIHVWLLSLTSEGNHTTARLRIICNKHIFTSQVLPQLQTKSLKIKIHG